MPPQDPRRRLGRNLAPFFKRRIGSLPTPQTNMQESPPLKYDTKLQPEVPPEFNGLPRNTPIELTMPASFGGRIKKLKLSKKYFIAIVVLLIAGAVVFIINRRSEPFNVYNGSSFSISYPKGFIESTIVGNLAFVQKNRNISSGSFVLVILPSSQLPVDISQLGSNSSSSLTDSFESNLIYTTISYLGPGKTLVSQQISQGNSNGKNTLHFSATVKSGNNSDGSVKALVTAENTGIYTVIVRATSDQPAIAKQADSILNSFHLQ